MEWLFFALGFAAAAVLFIKPWTSLPALKARPRDVVIEFEPAPHFTRSQAEARPMTRAAAAAAGAGPLTALRRSVHYTD